MKVDCRMKNLSSLQRTTTLREASTYKTTSKSAILAISGVIILGLQASERKRAWKTKIEHVEAVNVNDTYIQT